MHPYWDRSQATNHNARRLADYREEATILGSGASKYVESERFLRFLAGNRQIQSEIEFQELSDPDSGDGSELPAIDAGIKTAKRQYRRNEKPLDEVIG